MRALRRLLLFAATPAAAFLYWWTLPNLRSSPPWWRGAGAQEIFSAPGFGAIMILSLATGIACAFLETLETRLDDNVVAPFGGACVMIGLIYVFFG